MMKKVGIAVLFAASMSVATSAHAFYNFGCGFKETKVVQAKGYESGLSGRNLLNRLFTIVRGNFCGNFD